MDNFSLIDEHISKKNKKFIIIETIESKLSGLLSPYEKCEYIPINIANDILSITLPSCEIIHQYNEYHKIVKVKISDLLKAPITNWDYNRPPDETRCLDIARYIYLSKDSMDTMLYISFSNKKKTFDVIDGIHRYTALKIIKENNSKSLDIITPSEFGGNDDAIWLYNSYIILNIRFNSTEESLISLFKNLNKSIPIPELYVRDFEKERRTTIENIANTWQIKYKTHFSSNPRPNKPNVNRDKFIELLDYLYEKYKIREKTNVKLDYLLQDANTRISMNIPSKLTISVIDKCTASGCWLFVYPLEKLKDII